jgi:hypothetical protein
MTAGNGHIIDPDGQARRALQAAVAEHGPQVLSDPATLDGIGRDRLASLPGEYITTPIRRWRLRIKSPRPGGAEYSVLALSMAVAGASSCGLDYHADSPVPGAQGAFGVRRRCSRSRSIGPN